MSLQRFLHRFLVRGFFVRGVLSGAFCLEGFVQCGFRRPPSVITHLLQQKAKHHFQFLVSYVWNFFKVWRHMPLDSPPPVTNYHIFSDPLPLERDVLCGRPPRWCLCWNDTVVAIHTQDEGRAGGRCTEGWNKEEEEVKKEKEDDEKEEEKGGWKQIVIVIVNSRLL